MEHQIGRRAWLSATGLALATINGNVAAQTAPKTRTLLAINTSPRKGRTTSAGLAACLQAAREQDSTLQTELIELGDLNIPAYIAAGIPLKPGDTDDFPEIAKKLSAPEVVAIIVGSPVYFGNMSALCKTFLERCYTLRKDGFKWSGKLAGALAVGSTRNGGQELTVQSIHTSLMGQDMLITGTGQPSVRIGATLWNQNDSIAEDEFGLSTARDLGKRLATLAGR